MNVASNVLLSDLATIELRRLSPCPLDDAIGVDQDTVHVE